MANQLGMATVQTILTLYGRRRSHRRITQELSIHRETVSRYVRLEQAETSPADGSSRCDGLLPADAPAGDHSRG